MNTFCFRWLLSLSLCLLIFSEGRASKLQACEEVLRRFYGDEVATRFIDRGSHTEAIRSLQSFYQGSDTQILYSADFQLHFVPQVESFYAQYSFIPASEGGLQRMPSIFFLPSLDNARAHVLKVDLIRDQAGEVRDRNLFIEVLKTLYQASDFVLDEFQIALSDPHEIELLNKSLHETLQSTGYWRGAAPLVIRSKASHIPNTKIICFQDSLIKGVCQEDFHSRMESLDSDKLLMDLTDRLSQSEFIASLLKSGDWEFRLRIESFDIEVIEDDIPQEALIFKYVIGLRPAW